MQEPIGTTETETPPTAADAETAMGAAATETDLAAQLAAEKARGAELLDAWQRERAEFLNYKRRTEQERQREAQLAGMMVIAKVLPVLDDFELALLNKPQQKEVEGWVNGVALVAHKLRTMLESVGVQPIAAHGTRFDPALHEVVLVDGEGGDFVVAELRRGYTLNGNVIRPALVQVGKESDSRTVG